MTLYERIEKAARDGKGLRLSAKEARAINADIRELTGWKASHAPPRISHGSVPAAEWVAVSDPPKHEGTQDLYWVLQASGGRHHAIWVFGEFRWIGARGVRVEGVTHYQPIVRPSPPGAPREET